MNVETDKVARRRKKTPVRRVPTLIEQRQPEPFVFGWGSHLTHRERESLKERFALFAGIALAAILVILLAFGWYQDNVSGPAAAKAANNKPLAQIGNYTIRAGFFKRFEQFENQNLTSQQQQIQQQIAQLQGDTKNLAKNSGQLTQLQAAQAQIQQQLNTLPSTALTLLLNDQTMLQRASTEGVKVTPKDLNDAVLNVERNVGGRQHFQAYLQQSQLSEPEFKMLVSADILQSKLQPKLAKGVSHYQLKVRASHILIPTKKKALAEQLYQKALHGANFAALAKKYSTDPGSAKKGGDLGYFAQGQMVPAFDKAAFSMKVGEIRLVQSQYGWHIIKLTGRQNQKLSATDYQNAQQSAFQSWLQKQQALLHVQRFVAPQNLPIVVTPTTATGLAPSSNVVPQTQPVQPSTSQGSGKSGTKAQSPGAKTTGKSNSSSKTKKP